MADRLQRPNFRTCYGNWVSVICQPYAGADVGVCPQTAVMMDSGASSFPVCTNPATLLDHESGPVSRVALTSRIDAENITIASNMVEISETNPYCTVYF